MSAAGPRGRKFPHARDYGLKGTAIKLISSMPSIERLYGAGWGG